MLLLGTRDVIITATFSGMPGTEPEGGGGGEKKFLSAYAQGFTYTTFYVPLIIELDKYHYYSHLHMIIPRHRDRVTYSRSYS